MFFFSAQDQKMESKNKCGGAGNQGTFINPSDINMERFGYDVFYSVFIRFGVEKFPESYCDPIDYKDSTILNGITEDVICKLLYYRDEWMNIFEAFARWRSFDNIDDFKSMARLSLRGTRFDEGDTIEKIHILFSIHVELYLFLESRNKRARLEELPRSWYALYTQEIMGTLKGEIKVLDSSALDPKFQKLINLSSTCFLTKYFIPYGVNSGSSNLYRLFRESLDFNAFSKEKITMNDVEILIERTLCEESLKKLQVDERLEITPHNEVIKAARRKSLPGRSSRVQNESYSLRLYKWKNSRSEIFVKAPEPGQRLVGSLPEQSEDECALSGFDKLTLDSERTSETK
ncbi:hypothetical protein NPIL_636621 [Nephila pilipes]|uniref:Uncharacterized protein n=1 Tax=Nephila pilipes TaxID=299642 RepID=A0A8X6P7U3_NEPPI|nr:hypothetical protein NPIL_636621 [Nephila pilipes]